ncbi:DinB family protein [Pseudalkalibacillus caeni]|uniref:DinB family protein n=1 Tax=Exobacillus caeni TaxID=2574798 RepID=A0A5R9F442_9BACL|nr:DinB family protein [Pseudalkalibacillus caeni]TLS37116.1 DinB family protein [Pseudalkalibacillus caeni]
MQENETIREELLQYVSDLSDDQLNKKEDENSWSIIQVLEHLYLLEQVITKSISKELASEESVAVEDKPIHLSVNRTKKVSAPPYVTPSDKYQTLAEIKAKLAESRAALNRVVDEADEEQLEQKSMPHPAFGALSLKQWIPFIGLHEKRHLEQIKEIKEKIAQKQ